MFKVLAATRVHAADDDWWKSLTKAQQQAYIKKHPRSKYAKAAGSKSVRVPTNNPNLSQQDHEENFRFGESLDGEYTSYFNSLPDKVKTNIVRYHRKSMGGNPRDLVNKFMSEPEKFGMKRKDFDEHENNHAAAHPPKR